MNLKRKRKCKYVKSRGTKKEINAGEQTLTEKVYVIIAVGEVKFCRKTAVTLRQYYRVKNYFTTDKEVNFPINRSSLNGYGE